MTQRYPHSTGHSVTVITPKLDIVNTLIYSGYGSDSGKFHLVEEKRLPF